MFNLKQIIHMGLQKDRNLSRTYTICNDFRIVNIRDRWTMLKDWLFADKKLNIYIVESPNCA